MQKWIRCIPLGLCALYGFYPLTLLLGSKCKFGFEPHPILYPTLIAILSIAAAVLLMKKKPAYGISGSIAMVLTLPLCCVNAFVMLSGVKSVWTLALAALSVVACCILYFAQNFHKWYTRIIGFIAMFPILAFVSLSLLMGVLLMNFGYTQLLHTYEKNGYICRNYYVDEGALGEGWYTDVYSKESYPLIFGTFYPYYERIISHDPL